MEYVFTHICREGTDTIKREGRLFGRYVKEGEPVEAICPGCGATTTDAIPMRQQYSTSRVMQTDGQYNYISPLDGSPITSRTQHKEHMKRHGVQEMGNEYPKHREPNNDPMPRAGHDIVRSMEGGR